MLFSIGATEERLAPLGGRRKRWAHCRQGRLDQLMRLSRPSACWFQGTRWVRPAAPMWSRFARYQS